MSELRLETLTMPTARGRAGQPVAAAVLRGVTCTRSSTPARPTRRCGTTSATAGSARCCRTSSRTGTAATAGRPSTRSPCWRTTSCAPPSSSTSAAGCGRWCTSPPVASCCTGTRSSSRRTSPCATPGSPAAWSGTSGPSGTPRRPASRCTPPGCCSRTARRCCGCTSSSGCARSSSRSTPGCPRAPPCCWSTSGSSTRTTPRRRCTGGPTSPCPRRTTSASSPPPTRPGSSPTTAPCGGCRSRSSTDRTARTHPRVRGRRLLLRDRRRPAALDRCPGRPRARTGADLHRPAPRPQAVPVGEEPGRRPLAGVARAARPGVPRDPGRAGPHPAGAPADAGPGVVVVGRGVRPAPERRRTPSTATTGRWRERPCRVTWRS